MRHHMPQATYPNPVRTIRYCHEGKLDSYLVLLRVGFSLPRLLPDVRCALTAPFHPYQNLTLRGFGGIFSVALSVGFHLPGVTWHSVLWSPDFPLLASAKSDCLTDFGFILTECPAKNQGKIFLWFFNY